VTERVKRATVTIVTAFAQAIVGALFASLRSRANLVVENLALRQQLAVLQRRTPRPRLATWRCKKRRMGRLVLAVGQRVADR
jgi:hypothetical protein